MDETVQDKTAQDEKVEKLLCSVASAIRRHRLETPARLLLEMNMPLCGVMYNMSLLSAPLVRSFFGEEFQRKLSRIFERPENIEMLIRLIEQSEREART